MQETWNQVADNSVIGSLREMAVCLNERLDVLCGLLSGHACFCQLPLIKLLVRCNPYDQSLETVFFGLFTFQFVRATMTFAQLCNLYLFILVILVVVLCQTHKAYAKSDKTVL